LEKEMNPLFDLFRNYPDGAFDIEPTCGNMLGNPHIQNHYGRFSELGL
jgi:hypothetical protein